MYVKIVHSFFKMLLFHTESFLLDGYESFSVCSITSSFLSKTLLGYRRHDDFKSAGIGNARPAHKAAASNDGGANGCHENQRTEGAADNIVISAVFYALDGERPILIIVIKYTAIITKSHTLISV